LVEDCAGGGCSWGRVFIRLWRRQDVVAESVGRSGLRINYDFNRAVGVEHIHRRSLHHPLLALKHKINREHFYLEGMRGIFRVILRNTTSLCADGIGIDLVRVLRVLPRGAWAEGQVRRSWSVILG